MSYLVTNIASPNENIQVVQNEQTFNKGKRVITLGPSEFTTIDAVSDALQAFADASRVSIVDVAGKGEVFIYTSDASAGGAASEAMTFTGLSTDDEILSVDQSTGGAGAGNVIDSYGTHVDDGLTITWDADPGAGAIIKLTVLKAA